MELNSNRKKSSFSSSFGIIRIRVFAYSVVLFSSFLFFTTPLSLGSTNTNTNAIISINNYPSAVMNTIISAIEKLSSPPRTILLVRHGTTEMNEAMDPWGSPGFTDKRLWDTRLSEYGISQCKVLNKRIKNRASYKTLPGAKMFEEFNNVDLIVASPLTRALQTADLSLDGILPIMTSDGGIEKVIPRIALPIAAERLYMSSEVGKYRHQLEDTFPNWDFSNLPDSRKIESSLSSLSESLQFHHNNNSNSSYSPEIDLSSFSSAAWWYQPTDSSAYEEWRPPGIYAAPGEPKEEFDRRMRSLKLWLEMRPEKCIVLFSHWGVIKALTGLDFDNCEVRSVKLSQLLQEPVIDD